MVHLWTLSHPSLGFTSTLDWVQRSAAAGRKWIVTFDESGPKEEGVVPDSVDPNHDIVRKGWLWGNIMAGGAGVEFYFGYDKDDILLQDFRTRANLWKQARFALEFFDDNNVDKV